MEFISKENLKESTLKIDTFWSEANENLQDVIIKEEISSDLESYSTEYDVGNKNQDKFSPNNFTQVHEAKKEFQKKLIKSWPTFKKKIRKKNQEECSLLTERNLLCLHDMKNLKIFKRRLCCGDCKTLVCPECCKIMFSTLQNHFSGFDKKDCGIYTCNFCCIVFNSICALQAHIRIHTMETPYVCPDCGLIYNNFYFLILHLINKCFHVYKIVRYKCQSCPGIYFTPDTFLQHVQNLHMVCMFRCSYCSSLFNNSDEFEKHMEGSHQKQKVQYLNYFRCTLCSNVIVPKFMYEKHIDQHKENSEAFEVDYQCLCGEVYSLIGAFRAHIQFCNKKGILPSHWLFLQKKLRAHECMLLSNLQEEKLDGCTNYNSKNDLDFHLLKSSAQGIITKEYENNHKSLVLFEGIKNTKNEEKKKSLSEDINSELSETSKINFKKSDELVLNQTLKNINKPEEKGCSAIEGVPVFEKNLEIVNSVNILSNIEKKISESECLDENIATDAAKICQTQDTNKKGEEDEKNENRKTTENGDSCSKVFYDHIPCDHLGYLKIQCSEFGKWESIIADNHTEKMRETPTNYHVVMELDEKTGLMVSKKVDIDSIDDLCDFSSDNFNDEIVENSNSKILSPKHSSFDKGKNKVGNAFFTCPFCIVLFPKHNSIFQQFRLHLECYHPDAALNLTVNEIDRQYKSEKHKKNSTYNEFKPSLKHGKSSDTSLGKKSNLEIRDVDKNLKIENKTQKQKLSNDLKLDDKEDILLKEESKSIDKNGRKKDVFWTVKLSLKNTVGEEEDKNILEKNSTMFSCSQISDIKKVKGEEIRVKLSETKNQNFNLKSLDSKKDFNIKNMKTNYNLQKQGIYHKENDIVNLCNTNVENENFEHHLLVKEKFISENKKNIQSSRLMKNPLRSEVKHECLNLEFAEDWENVKESNFCNVTDVEFYSKLNSKKDHLIESLKQKTSEKSKRESEVWSEFYESLQLAEKLKKTKKNKLSFQKETDQKSSFLPDYSSKRIVKKPKRYRQSSESEFSFEENNHSNSESEFSQLKEVMNKQSEEKIRNNDTDQILKKQELLNKLQNVDQKLVNYLFDLISRREKCFNLYKKHSNLRAYRHSQDLKIYRKKVLNGIKHRGRPLKMLRHQNVASEKDQLISAVTENFKETDCHRLSKKSSNQLSSSCKSGEKKRGRPRKIMESTKLKERRRSDKEVDFIEKNFEKEENESSPSKRKRKLSSKLQYYKKGNLADEKDDFSSGQLITNKIIDSHKKFYCAVCKEIFQEPIEFKQHIIVHRLEENTYQCMECGECFVVRPSLEKHLLAFHKIKNTERYIIENQCCNTKKEAPEIEAEPLKENQCKVCKDQFERAIDLTKHFRIHGMAFLKEFKKEGKIKL